MANQADRPPTRELLGLIAATAIDKRGKAGSAKRQHRKPDKRREGDLVDRRRLRSVWLDVSGCGVSIIQVITLA
ncbi:hypothetical protein EYR15_11690 [Hansschlegelia quercus]|uniref:Uncharacterized protein n=1 Tax=Hansschlegelia quercus TaxID=2528245 RepID=A0A4V2JDY1_9HYPH|nr:hypothetical protein EYR15_11690 [Hansschlegelia quercus]